MFAVGRPVVLVDVSVGWRDLGELARGEIDHGEALLEKRILYFAGCGSLCDQWAGSACGVFGEEHGDGFAIGRPAGIGQESFYVGEYFCCAAGCIDDVELRLALFRGVGEECDFLAVG